MGSSCGSERENNKTFLFVGVLNSFVGFYKGKVDESGQRQRQLTRVLPCITQIVVFF